MKKGLSCSVVLAPGGTAMFWVTQGGEACGVCACCARAGPAIVNDATAIHVPARTVRALFMLLPVLAILWASLGRDYVVPSVGGQSDGVLLRRTSGARRAD